MPAIYWLPLPGVTGPAELGHIHAAFSGWFDQPREPCETAGVAHHAVTKPYRLSPTSKRADGWGVEVAILDQNTFLSLVSHIAAKHEIRLGRQRTAVGLPTPMLGTSWNELTDWPGESTWRVSFLTPFIARTGNRSSPFPAPGVVLRAATEAWAAFSGAAPIEVTPVEQRHLWVSRIDVQTTDVTISGHRHPGLTGQVVFRADDDSVARKASTLFRLAEYCGMGSFRGKGMGVVSIALD